MTAITIVGMVAISVYFGCCIGFIAKRLGKRPWLFGVPAALPGLNLVVLGLLAFTPSGTGQRVFEEESKPAGRETGLVKWFSAKKGYGFIVRASGEEIFVHHSEIAGSGFKELAKGETVEFSVSQERKGPVAQGVKKHRG